MKRLSFCKVCLFIAVVFLFSAVSLAEPPKYTLTPLGSFGGNYSIARGINDAGQVVGYSTVTAQSYPQAFLWQDGVMTNLGLLPGGDTSVARSINDTGQVAGMSTTYQREGATICPRAFLWQNGVMNSLDLPIYGLYGGNSASSINNAGQVVGSFDTYAHGHGDLLPEAFLWQNGVMTNLGTLPRGDRSVAYGINNAGQVVGYASTTQYISRAFLWQNGVMTNLGTLGGDFISEASAINDAGQVVGSSTVATQADYRAFLWQNGVMTNLGTLPGDDYSNAYGINNLGQVVGMSMVAAQDDEMAFLWQEGTMYDLNAYLDSSGFGWSVEYAYAINNLGQIVGYGTNPSSGHTEAFLLTPVAVPEPASLLLLGLGGLVMRKR